jgi:hypothetical protein
MGQTMGKSMANARHCSAFRICPIIDKRRKVKTYFSTGIFAEGQAKKAKCDFAFFGAKTWKNRTVFPALSEKGKTAFCFFANSPGQK